MAKEVELPKAKPVFWNQVIILGGENDTGRHSGKPSIPPTNGVCGMLNCLKFPEVVGLWQAENKSQESADSKYTGHLYLEVDTLSQSPLTFLYFHNSCCLSSISGDMTLLFGQVLD